MAKQFLQTLTFSFLILALSTHHGHAQTPPSGSYLKSCTSPYIDGSDLWATCPYCNGQTHGAVLFNYEHVRTTSITVMAF